ncbi:MAG TPA: recombination mediator RecR [Candidatus Kryptonia bacterium]|nr:recombination mediator RecR [Candidatus Kryptonia bacterium]
MATFPAPLSRIIQELVKLPGIGEKTATRLAFHLLRTDRAAVEALAAALMTLRAEMRLCSVCFAFTAQDPCALCSDPARSNESICVVEGPADVIAVDGSGQFRGRYHVLHGSLAPLDGVGPEQLRIKELLHRLQDGTVREVILATNPTVEGEATAMYIAKLIKPLGVRVTRIAHGLPMGADVEYADTMTLGKALEGRREM